jgi:DNA invertase Pin-like site-specific DNA recombinase
MSKEGQTQRVALYARVSLGQSHGQDPMVQINQLREYAKQRGLEVWDEYVDVCSGVREKRPALDRLMKDAFQRKFSVMMVSALDRCSRSVTHMLSMVEELQHHGVALISLREQWDLTGGPQAKLLLTMCSALGAMERDILRDRVRVGMAMRKLAAEKAGIPWRAGRPPITEETVQKVLKLRAEGLSLREIERKLDRKISKSAISRIVRERGVTVPEGVKKERP